VSHLIAERSISNIKKPKIIRRGSSCPQTQNLVIHVVVPQRTAMNGNETGTVEY